ncbi:MAG: SpoIID/LytB domain-containing protein [Actinomycetota bacterium]
MRRLVLFVLLIACLVCVGSSAPAAVTTPAPASPQHLILDPTSAATLFTFEGLYPQKKGLCDFKQRKPLRAKYRGRLELILRPDGSIEVIDALSFSNYLRGLAEVPNSWPAEALKAQAIAARSYALESLQRAPSGRSYDICSTDQCQVYRGAAIELGAFGERWVAAVEGTRGKVLTYHGSVLPAYFFSTSTGRTRSSFPGGTPQPWLPSVSGEDAKAPLAHWTATVTLANLSAILRHSGDWPGGSITSATQSGDTVHLSGSGHSVSLSRSAVENDLNNDGPCLFPQRYPSQTGSAQHGPLPQTVPSSTYTLTQKGSSVVFAGRGWGHGVGMSQYGANYMALAGSSSTQILKHFYGPALITTVKEPGEIRVLAADSLSLARISIDGPVRVTTETGSVLATGNRFEVRGGKVLGITRGIGPSLAPILQVTPTSLAFTSTPGGTIAIPFTISRSARIAVELKKDDTVVLITPDTSFVSGDNTITVSLAKGDDGKPLGSGSYVATVIGYDGLDRVRSGPIAVSIGEPANPPVLPVSQRRSWVVWIITVAGVALILGILWFFGRRRLSRT